MVNEMLMVMVMKYYLDKLQVQRVNQKIKIHCRLVLLLLTNIPSSFPVFPYQKDERGKGTKHITKWCSLLFLPPEIPWLCLLSHYFLLSYASILLSKKNTHTHTHTHTVCNIIPTPKHATGCNTVMYYRQLMNRIRVKKKPGYENVYKFLQ
jgi:hypothetical protein